MLTAWQELWPKVNMLQRQVIVALMAGDDRTLKRIVARLHPLVMALGRIQPLVFSAWSIRD